jgi:hypothetical protein
VKQAKRKQISKREEENRKEEEGGKPMPETDQTRMVGVKSVSGEIIPCAISGETLSLVSGTGPILAKVSGEVVSLPSTQPVKISGETVIGKVSGETIMDRLPTVVSGSYIQIPSTSGGVVVGSAAVIAVVVKALSTNSGKVWLGAPGVVSGRGLILEPGESVGFTIDNLNRIYAYAERSGEYISHLTLNY